MSRYRLVPSLEQEALLRTHCEHARFVWNLAVEQQSWWRPGRGRSPRWAEQCRQLADARHEFPWLGDGSTVVQQQALLDYCHAMTAFVSGIRRKPKWRKAGRSEGFRIVNVKPSDTRRLSRHVGEVRVPKVGWVRFRWSQPPPKESKSFRVKLNSAGRWHIAFAVAREPVPGPGTGEVVGVDRGITVSAALSTGELLHIPRVGPKRRQRINRLKRKFNRAERGSNRREQLRLRIARLYAQDANARKDWAEKLSTDLARRFDVIRLEDLDIRNMIKSARGTREKPGRNVRQKAGLNRAISASGWSPLERKLNSKAPGRIEKVDPHYTSRTCSACGHVAAESRESQARFRCVACGFQANADVNAAINIAAGHAVTARGGSQLGLVNREPTAA